MPQPNYDQYSLKELYQALGTVDEDSYPERVATIRARITKLEVEQAQAVPKTQEKPTTGIDVNRYLSGYRSGANFLYIVSCLFGASVLINRFTFVELGNFGYQIQFDFPGLSLVPVGPISVLAVTVGYLLQVSLVTGAIGAYLNRGIFKFQLAIAWGLLALGFRLWGFLWWPSPNFDFHFSLNSNFFGVPVAFKINFISAFFFSWAAVLAPGMQKELEESFR